MHYAGIDLHKRTLVVAIENESGLIDKPKTFACKDTKLIHQYFDHLRPFRAVIEASGSYRWLYDLLSLIGEIVLAHPRRLKAIVDGRAKTDKKDATLLVRLLKADLIPTAYIPPKSYQHLRDLTRARTRMSRHRTEAKNELHAMMTRANVHSPYKTPFCKKWSWFVSKVDFGPVGNVTRDEIFRRLEHFGRELLILDESLVSMSKFFPEVKVLTDIHGVGLFTALLIIGEIGEPWRFSDKSKVGAYAGLTARVSQSGDHCYHGHITRQGSPWLRWALVQTAIHVVRKDKALSNFYTRIRKRSSAKIARVAVARKLAEICWLRLARYHWEQAA